MSNRQGEKIERHKRFLDNIFAGKKQLRDKNILERKSEKDAGGEKSLHFAKSML